MRKVIALCVAVATLSACGSHSMATQRFEQWADTNPEAIASMCASVFAALERGALPSQLHVTLTEGSATDVLSGTVFVPILKARCMVTR